MRKFDLFHERFGYLRFIIKNYSSEIEHIDEVFMQWPCFYIDCA